MALKTPRHKFLGAVSMNPSKRSSISRDQTGPSSVPWQSLLSQTRTALAANLTSALDVGGPALDDTDDAVRKIKKTTLHAQTKITRSTITKIAQGGAKIGKGHQAQATPTLDTLCRLAWALKIPPAFLLMSKDDWTRLAKTINALPSAGIEKMDTQELTGNARVLAGLKLAERLKIYPIKIASSASSDEKLTLTPDMQADIRFRNEYARAAIMNTTSITQREAVGKDDHQRNLLTAFGAIFGAMGNPDKQVGDK